MSKSREKLMILSIIALVAAVMLFIAYSLQLDIRASNRAPVISCASDTIYVSVDATDEDLLLGVTAMDAEDGDLTSSVVVGSISSFVDKGKCEVTYAVFDSDNRVATAKRMLQYTDYHAPRFVLGDDFVYYSGESVNPLKHVKAIDCLDGDITNRISMSWLESENDAKTVEFQVINSRGDFSTLTASITTIERSAQAVPVITLKDYIVYLQQGDLLDPLDYVKIITVSKSVYSVSEFGAEKISFDMGGFDSSVPGTYRVNIFCENQDNIGSSELIVVVEG